MIADITYAQAYTPYGTSLSSAGESETPYGFTGEITDGTGNIYLRARYYNPNDGRFLSRDTWSGDVNNPLSLNRWMYVEGNPVNFTDPSGFCTNCYIFYFPGAGFMGDTNNDGDMFDNLGRDKKLLDELKKLIPNINIRVMLPYEAGDVVTRELYGNEYLDAAENFLRGVLDEIISSAKADEIMKYIDCENDSEDKNVTFIGFSGGGQPTYSTALDLESKVFVDNLVLIGAPFMAYAGVKNIGHIWDLVSINDTEIIGKGIEKVFGWDKYNSGYRTDGNGWYNYYQEYDIYKNGATKCTFFGHNYIHYGAGDYFQESVNNYKFNGLSCSGSNVIPTGSPTKKENKSRLDALVTFLINVVGVGR